MLVIGLKEKPNLFLPLEYRAGREGKTVAIRYSLGWTVIGPVGRGSCSTECSANFLRLEDSSVICTSGLDLQDGVLCDDPKTGVVFPERLVSEDAGKEIFAEDKCSIGLECDANESKHPSQPDEIERQARDEELSQQLDRMWKTDFENSEVETRVCTSLEDKRALEVMERTLKTVDGHYQVALPWRHDPPYLQQGSCRAKRLTSEETTFER